MDKKTITICAPAKINLFLEIVGKRPDNYHELITIMQTVSLFDEIKIESFGAGDGKITIECSDKTIPTDERNIVYKAAKFMQDNFGIKDNLKIYIDKKIPIGAGLGGGSSDGATTIKALSKLWNLNASKTQLEKIASKIGADVTFFLTGGTALCRGIGDIVEPIKSIGKKNIVLVNPGIHISTAEAYKSLCFPLTKIRQIPKILSDFRGFLDGKDGFFFNRFEEFIFPIYPQIEKIKNTLENLGCISLMTGSGSTVFAITKSKEHSQEVFEEISKSNYKVWNVETL